MQLYFYTFLNGNLFDFALCTKSRQNAVVVVYICVFDGQLIPVAINDEQMKALVMFGNRLPLEAIKGPTDLPTSAKTWIDQCWRDLPDERPSFNSKLLLKYR